MNGSMAQAQSAHRIVRSKTVLLTTMHLRRRACTQTLHGDAAYRLSMPWPLSPRQMLPACSRHPSISAR